MIVHLADIAYEFKYLHDAVAPIVSRIKLLKDEVLASGFVVAVRGHRAKKATRRDALGPKKGRAAAAAVAAVELDDAGKAEAAEKVEVEMMAGRALIDAINMTALLRAEMSESAARESELARAKVEVQGGWVHRQSAVACASKDASERLLVFAGSGSWWRAGLGSILIRWPRRSVRH